MANNFTNSKSAPGIVAKAAAKMLVDELQFTKSIAKADPKDYEGKNGYSAGDTIYINKPPRFVAGQSFDITSSIQDITEEKVPLVLDTISTIGLQVNSLEFATVIQLKSLLKRVIKPAVTQIAQDVENRFLIKAKNAVANEVGIPGSTVFDTDTILSAKEIMDKYLAPKDDGRFFLYNATAGRSAVNARKGLFQKSDEIAKQYKTGSMGRADSFNWIENEMLPTHTNGTQTGSFTVATTSVDGDTTMALTGLSGGTLTAGTVFTVAGRFAVHPTLKNVYTNLAQFVVTANNTAVSTAYTGVKIALYNGGAIQSSTTVAAGLQNISSLPTSGDVVTILGAASTGYVNNLAFHRDAFRMVSVPLVMPTAVEWAAQETYEGITVAIVRAFDVLQRRMITRMDFLGGIVADRPEWAARISA